MYGIQHTYGTKRSVAELRAAVLEHGLQSFLEYDEDKTVDLYHGNSYTG